LLPAEIDGADDPRVLHPLEQDGRERGPSAVALPELVEAPLQRRAQLRRIQIVMADDERDVARRIVEEGEQEVLDGDLVVPRLYCLRGAGFERGDAVL